MIKLALGTVQFGSRYGIANQNGQTSFIEAKKILQFAKSSNIDLIDTAMSYGNSEKIIGDTRVKNFKIVSKLPNIPKGCKNVNLWLEDKIQLTLKNLNIKSLYGLLIHNTRNLNGALGKKLVESLIKFKLDGLIKKIGISIYDPSEFENIINLEKFDIVQAPLNIIDRRIENSGWLSKLHSKKIEIHVRSVFLQGLLLMPREKIPKKFNKWSNIWDQWFAELNKKKLSATQACLLYPLSIPEIDRVIVGVENFNQLNEIVSKSKMKIPRVDFSFMISNDSMLIDPTNWHKL